jgi:hypothetical protein
MQTKQWPGIFGCGVSHAQPRLRRSRRRYRRGKGGPALGMLGSTPSGRAQGSVSPAAATETKEVAVTEKRSFKRRVRERMSKTGESYTAARTQMAQKRDRVKAARTRLAAADERVSDAKIKEATGKKWDQWFSILDRGGARDKKHGEIARFLTDTHDVEGWWAQSITVGYERARGMRLKYQQSDGFTISASKTIAVPLDVLFDAFVDGRKRKRWLTDRDDVPEDLTAGPLGALRLGGRIDTGQRRLHRQKSIEIDGRAGARAAGRCR